MRRVLFTLICLVAALPLRAAEAVTEFTLDNGLEIVVIEDRRAPVVVHMLWYKVGSADEPAGKSGIAHFLEHLMFKGTENLESGEFSRTVSANGGQDNAFTSYDYTGYFQRVAADRLELMMEMEADRMVNLRINEEDVRTERGVVLEERNQRTDSDPGAIFGEQRRAAQFLNHRYGVPIIGWRQEIESLTREDFLAFYKEHYAPNNAVLVVAGDVEPQEVKALAEKHYGPIAANPEIADRMRPQEPPQLTERRLTFRDPRVAQPYIVRTYLAPERNSGSQEEAAALFMLAQVLGGSGATSVLGAELEFEAKTAVYTAAFYGGQSLDPTTFGILAVPTPEVSLADIEAQMDEVIARFIEEGVDEDQLRRLKAQIRASNIYAQDDVGSLARRYGAALTSGLTVEDVQAWPEILEAVTGDDIIDAAERIFDPQKSVTGWLMRPDTATDEEVSQ